MTADRALRNVTEGNAMQALLRAELRPSFAAEVMAFFWGSSTPNQPNTSDEDDPFMEAALNRGSAQSWSGWDEPFLSRINYSYAKLFLIGLEVPENTCSHCESMVTASCSMRLFSFSPSQW